MTKILAFDIDGVALDHPRGMAAWAKAKGIPVGCEPEDLYCYSMTPMFPQMSMSEIMEALAEFSVHKDFANLPEIQGFSNFLDSVRARVPDIKCIAITAPGASSKTIEYRKRNLAKYRLDEIHVLELGSSKLKHLSALPAGTPYIDDVPSHVLAAESVGLQGVLFRQPHNVGASHLRVLNSWEGADQRIVEALMSDVPFSRKK